MPGREARLPGLRARFGGAFGRDERVLGGRGGGGQVRRSIVSIVCRSDCKPTLTSATSSGRSVLRTLDFLDLYSFI
jgi:hypothetical protein